jgi:hypothetical protein
VAAIGLAALVKGSVFGPDLDLGLRVLDPIFDVAFIPALKRFADGLYVVTLRHRASIPQPCI